MPDPRTAPSHGLLAGGGDLAPGTILAAYRGGIFPWPDSEGRLLWWSPDPRAILPLDGFHESRSLRRLRRQHRLHVTFDLACPQVIDGCATEHGATWITPAMREAYLTLFDMGWVHSVEVWDDDVLAGGLYGVGVGGLFAAESMFHRRRDASKIALATLVERLAADGFTLLDVQLMTPHLRSLGVIEVPRAAYLAQVDEAVRLTPRWGRGRSTQLTQRV